MVFTDWYWAIPRNILYVKEAEMKIGLETTLSFLWKVSFSTPPSANITPSQDDRVRLIQKPESLNRQGRRGYVVLNPEEAAKLWVPDVIIDKVIIANTIIIESKIL